MKEELKYIHSLIEKREEWDSLPDNPLITVIVSTFNHEDFIRDCMDGILMQETDFDYEIIIKEDFSTDGTREILLEYYKNHADKMRLWLCKENLYNQNLKPGIPFFARGKYIAKCEGDDYWTDPQKLQRQVEYLEGNPKAQFSFHHSSILKGDQIIGKRPKSGSGDLRLEDLLFRKTYPTMSLVHRNSENLTKKLVALRKEFKTGDFLLVLLLASRGPGYLFPEVMGVYRVHSGGIYSPLGEIKKLQMGIHNRRAALKHIPMNFKQKMICRLMILLRQIKILSLKVRGLFKRG